MSTIYSKLSESTRRRFTEAQVDEHLRAVLKKHIRETFSDALEHVAFRLQVSNAIKTALAEFKVPA
jgi:hypothetical protein